MPHSRTPDDHEEHKTQRNRSKDWCRRSESQRAHLQYKTTAVHQFLHNSDCVLNIFTGLRISLLQMQKEVQRNVDISSRDYCFHASLYRRSDCAGPDFEDGTEYMINKVHEEYSRQGFIIKQSTIKNIPSRRKHSRHCFGRKNCFKNLCSFPVSWSERKQYEIITKRAKKITGILNIQSCGRGM